MKIDKNWQEQWDEIEVPKEAVYQAIEKGLGKDVQQPKETVRQKTGKRLTKVRLSYLIGIVASLFLVASLVYKGVSQTQTELSSSFKEPASKGSADMANEKLKETADVEPSFKSEVEIAPNTETATMDESVQDKQYTEDQTKLVKSYHQRKETTDFVKTINTLNQLITQHQGYIVNLEQIGGDANHESKWANYEIRVPTEQITPFLEGLKEIGQTVSISETANDQTFYYSDQESRVKALEIEEEALLKLLAKGEKIEDLLTIQERLASVRGEKNSLIQAMKIIDKQVSDSLVTISIQEVNKLTKEESSSIKQNVQKNWQKQRQFWLNLGQVLAVAVLSNYPYVIILIAGLSFFTLRKLKKKKQSS